jgi:hypothetical protein
MPTRSHFARAMSSLGEAAVTIAALCLGIEPAMLTAAVRCCCDTLNLAFLEHV